MKDTETVSTQIDHDTANSDVEIVHSRATRWMHWTNFPLLTIMIWSGLRIYWADVTDPFAVGVGDTNFTLFPTWFNEFLGLKKS